MLFRIFLVRLRFFCVSFSFISACLVVSTSTCNFPYPREFWSFLDLVVGLLSFLVFSAYHETLSMPNFSLYPDCIFVLFVLVSSILYKQFHVTHIHWVVNLFFRFSKFVPSQHISWICDCVASNESQILLVKSYLLGKDLSGFPPQLNCFFTQSIPLSIVFYFLNELHNLSDSLFILKQFVIQI